LDYKNFFFRNIFDGLIDRRLLQFFNNVYLLYFGLFNYHRLPLIGLNLRINSY